MRPFETEEGSGFQLANSLIAIGQGGLTGVRSWRQRSELWLSS